MTPNEDEFHLSRQILSWSTTVFTSSLLITCILPERQTLKSAIFATFGPPRPLSHSRLGGGSCHRLTALIDSRNHHMRLNLHDLNLDLDFELGSCHMAHRHVSVIDLYLHNKLHSNWKTFCGRSGGHWDGYITSTPRKSRPNNNN